MGAAEDPDLATVGLPGLLLDLGDLAGGGLGVLQACEDQVAVLGCEGPARAAGAGVHQHRVGVLERVGVREGIDGAEVLAVEVERFLGGPQLLDQTRPLIGIGITGLVVLLGEPEHRELLGEPARHHVDPEPATGDMVGGDGHLRGQHRMDDRHVHGREDLDPLGARQQRRGPGERLETTVRQIRLPTEPPPTRHRDHRIKADPVRVLSQPQTLLPAAQHLALDIGQGHTAAHVGRERRQLQTVLVVEDRRGPLVDTNIDRLRRRPRHL